MPTAAELTRHHDPDPDENPWVSGPPPPEVVQVVPYDPAWPGWYRDLASSIQMALGDAVLAIEHVGSTSVAELAAKDVIDIDLAVADPRDEAAYLLALERPVMS